MSIPRTWILKWLLIDVKLLNELFWIFDIASTWSNCFQNFEKQLTLKWMSNFNLKFDLNYFCMNVIRDHWTTKDTKRGAKISYEIIINCSVCTGWNVLIMYFTRPPLDFLMWQITSHDTCDVNTTRHLSHGGQFATRRRTVAGKERRPWQHIWYFQNIITRY